MNKRHKAGYALLALVALLLAAGWLLRPEGHPYPPAIVRLATIPGEVSAAIWIAEEQGYFLEQNLEVEITRFQTGADATQALIAGKADFATCVEYVVVSNGFGHKDLRILAALATTKFTQVVSGGGATGPRDLAGKTIGVPRGTHVDYYLGRFLALHEIGLDEVNIVDMSPIAQLSALQEGRADAVIAFEPYLTRIKRALDTEAVTWGLRDHDSYWLLISKAAILQRSPSVADRLLQAVIKAERLLNHDSSTARRIVDRSISDTLRERVSWEQFDFDVCLPQSLLTVMEEEARWMIDTGLTPERTVPNYLDYLDYSALYRVKSRGVTLIK